MKPALFTAAFVLLALAESVLGIVQPRRTATQTDWEAASALVRAQLAPGDLIVFSPAWIDPEGRKHLGDLMPAQMIARSDADRYARIWQLSVHEAAQADEARGLAAAIDQRFGELRLRRYDKTAVKVVQDLTADFGSAKVLAGEQACRVDGDARICSRTRVERRVMEVDYQPRLGILVPVTPGEVTTIEYDDVPGGSLVVYIGLHDYYARKNVTGTANVGVRQDGGAAQVLTVGNTDGWKRFQIPLSPGKHQLRFEVESTFPQRFVGIHAEVRAP